MAVLLQNTAEGGTNGTTVTSGNSGGSSGDAFASATSAGAGNTLTYDNATALTGSLSIKAVQTGANVDLCYWALASAQTDFWWRGGVRISALPAVTTNIARFFSDAAFATIIGDIAITTSGKIQVRDAGVNIAQIDTAHTLSLNTWYVFTVRYSTSTGWVLNAYPATSSTAFATISATGSNATTGLSCQSVRFGIGNASALITLNMDDIAVGTTSTITRTDVATAPVAAFTSSTAGLVASFDASTSAATASGATITGYAWTFGDSGTGTGAAPSHTYASAGTYTATLTVTDSNAQTNAVSHTVTVVAPAASVVATAVVSSTGFTVAGAADLLTAVTDTDQTTFGVSAANPSGAVFRIRLGALVQPVAGTDMTVTIESDRTNSSSGTVSATLYEGTTVRATAAAQGLASATAGAATASVLTFTFPAASIANVTSWNALEVAFTGSAA